MPISASSLAPSSALMPFSLPGDGAVDERGVDLRRQWRKRRAEHIPQPGRLEHQAAQFGENWGGGVRLVVLLIPLRGDSQQTGLGQGCQFPLHRATPRLRERQDLVGEEAPVGVAVEEGKHPLPHLGKERVGHAAGPYG
ncbi:MAG: hypothetical protein ACYC0T_06605 [Ramlibacter sp.]